jgi:hypothetical protein
VAFNNSGTSAGTFGFCGFLGDLVGQECLGYDSEVCSAETRVPEASPTVRPTRIPVTRTTEPPVMAPAPNTVVAVSGGAARSFGIMGSFVSVAVVAVLAAAGLV